MTNILFRTAGGKAKGKELGLGHIYRTINLAKELKNDKIYFSIEDFGGVRKILQQNGFNKIKSITNEIKNEQDFKETKLQIKKWKIDIIIIDRYKISKLYIKKLSKIIKVIVISDLNEINFKADLIVNGFVGFKNQIIKNKFDSKCIVGPNYQILNKEFSKKNNLNSKKIDLLISFGGYDEKGIIKIITSILPDYLEKMKVKIILGPASKKNSKLKLLQKKYAKNLYVKNSTNNMAKEMSDVRYGLCTGGLTTYEFACMKIPIGIISDENHQIITAKHWEKLGYGKNLGIINKMSKEKIKNLLEEIYQKKFLSLNKKIIIDGAGSSRVVNEILKMKENY